MKEKIDSVISQNKLIGRTAISLLLFFNMFEILINQHLIVVNLFMIIVILITLYAMTTRDKSTVEKQQIAESVIELSKLILKVESREQLLDEILKEVLKSIPGADKGSIITVMDDNVLTFEACVGFDLDKLRQFDIKLEDTILYTVNNGNIKQAIFVNDIMSFNQGKIREDVFENMTNAGIDEIKATISSPILLDDKFIGMINIDSLSYRGLSEADVNLVERYSKEVSNILGLYFMFEKTLENAKYDHLTNAFSRGNFMNVMDQIIEDGQYKNSGFSILYCDLDNLKKVNDQYGHKTGDLYLRKLVDGMQHHLRGEEIISRFGGDEFVILLLRDDREIEEYLEDCSKWFDENPIRIKETVIRVDYSIGYSRYPDDALGIVNLINIADTRMYNNKKQKRTSR